MAAVKSKLKLARDALGNKDYGTAKSASLAALEIDPSNYNAYGSSPTFLDFNAIG
jgi:superkiller protein 3